MNLEILVLFFVAWNAILQTVWFYRTKDKH